VANHSFSGYREWDLDAVKEQNLVIHVYDEAGNVIEAHEHKGDFKEFVSFARITPHFPLKGSSMTPLSSGDCEASERITRNNSVQISLGWREVLTCIEL
jgi:hypothetical protein